MSAIRQAIPLQGWIVSPGRPAFAGRDKFWKYLKTASGITLAEPLEGAEDTGMVKAYLARYAWQGIHRLHAESVAARQKRSTRRMGENDAWQCAVAGRMIASLVGHHAAFRLLGPCYEDFRRPDAARRTT